MPATTRKPRTSRPRERSVKVLIAPSAGQPLTLIRIRQDDVEAHYWVTAIPADRGLVFTVEKPGHEGDESYTVVLDDVSGDSCDCKGFTYGNFCKHSDCLRALQAADRLPLPDAYRAGHSHGIPF